MKHSWLIMSAVLSTAGCATYRNWRPAVDPKGADQAALEQDYADCRRIALDASGGTGKGAGRGAALGTAAGAAVGVMLGAIGGDPGGGAATGAVLGASAGGASGGLSAEERFRRVYANCMTGRGRRVLE